MSRKSGAVLLMLLSAFSFAGMATMVKLSGDFPVVEKVFFRNLVSTIIAYFIIRAEGVSLIGHKGSRRFLLMRSSLGIVGVVLNFYAIGHLYLADSAMLNKLSPFFVTFFAILFLKERVTKVQIPAMILVFAAAQLIIKPRFDFSIIPALAGFTSAIMAGSAYTFVRYLKDREHPATIVFFFSAFTLLFTIPVMVVQFQVPNLVELLYLVGIGIFGAGGQFALTFAYRFEKASEISVYQYTNIIFAAFIGWMIWGEVSDIYSLIGGAVIILVSVFLFRYNKKQVRAASDGDVRRAA